MNITKIAVQGTATTAANGSAARKVNFPPLPIDGTWSINGKILAVDSTGGRATTHQVQFNIAASGVCVGGTASETDSSGPSSWTTQPSSNPFTGTLVTLDLNAGGATVNPTVELAFTGATIGGGVPAEWFYDLEIILGTI